MICLLMGAHHKPVLYNQGPMESVVVLVADEHWEAAKLEGDGWGVVKQADS